jgi:capsular polysaccharide biosynthesis protein
VNILNQNVLLSTIEELGLDVTAEELASTVKIADIKDTDLLKITLTSSDVPKVLKISEALIQPFIAQGQAIYLEKISMENERLAEMQSEIKNIESVIAKTQSMIASFSKENKASSMDHSLTIILLQNMLPNYQSNLAMLKDQRSSKKLMMSDARPFKVFESPTVSDKPVSPQTKRNVILAGFLGLMMGIFLAFVIDFWRKGSTKKEG